MEISVKAGELVGIIYDALYKQYINPESERTQKSLNMLCVRLVFCLYAEDAGIFNGNRSMFHDYLQPFDAKDIRKALIELFKTLDTKPEDRDPYDTSDLAKFPYVNGGLFADENIEIPHFTDEIKNILLANASDGFDWSAISPTIFGAVFESTLNPETRRSGGMHYTSIENIHKVIDPLFLDDLRSELNEIKTIQVERTKTAKLKAFQTKLAGVKWLDPACGSGNFLTETYISIRRLENEVLMELQHGQIVFGEAINPIQVSISQFYGIEINDFAVTVAKTALWIAESQMMKETEDIVHSNLDFLPLKTNAYIVEGNALRIDWKDVVSPSELDYIMGNPPFVGHQNRTETQIKDMEIAFYDLDKHGKLDYVCAWYNKAADMIKTTKIKSAFVSTNSIVQGESVSILWKFLLEEKEMQINFAYRSFPWNSESTSQAAVHCVIIGFSEKGLEDKRYIFDGFNNKIEAENINGYLLDAPDVYIQARGRQLTKGLPEMVKGSQATDGGNLFLTQSERDELVEKYPVSEQFIKRFLGAEEFINNKIRYCLWLKNVDPSLYRNIPLIKQRLENIVELRKNSPTKSVQKDATTPMLFTQIRQPESDYMVIPRHSSENRRYIPFGYCSRDIICGDANMLIPEASLYLFGVMNSNIHNAWIRAVCGRLEMRYRYTPAVYNNFPWCTPTDEQRSLIEKTAQGILDARALYPTSSLADLYDPMTMPPELQKAHTANDKAVMQAYGFSIKDTTEADCVAALMKMYQELTK
jgi:type I restriction-modification system DNA methylase subunit